VNVNPPERTIKVFFSALYLILKLKNLVLLSILTAPCGTGGGASDEISNLSPGFASSSHFFNFNSCGVITYLGRGVLVLPCSPSFAPAPNGAGLGLELGLDLFPGIAKLNPLEWGVIR